MKILGLNASFWHDPSAALLIDGVLVAAAEEERFSRNKHAVGEQPCLAARACLESAGIAPGALDAVACSWSAAELERERWPTIRRNLGRSPRRALCVLCKSGDLGRRREAKLAALVAELGLAGIPRLDFEHHLCHAASSYYASGFPSAAVLSIDATSDRVTTMFLAGRGRELEPLGTLQYPDSLGLFYSAFTDFLGFTVNDGEYKLMGMSAFDRTGRIDLGDVLRVRDGDLRIDDRLVAVSRRRRWRGRAFGARMVERFGPPREGDDFTPGHAEIAGAVQRRFESAALALIDWHLAVPLAATRRLCLAGGCALNVLLNGKLAADPRIDAVYVPPAPGDAGTALGAAALATVALGGAVAPVARADLGPEYDDGAIAAAIARAGVAAERVDDPVAAALPALLAGKPVAWFQGRMEFGPRALGHRSILAHPGIAGVADRINTAIKFRERWRPFSPMVLAERMAEIFGAPRRSPFLSFAWPVVPAWRDRIGEVVHVDGSTRPQSVTAEENPLVHRLLSEFAVRTGLPCLLNTSLNRRDEPIVCTPEDALRLWQGSGLTEMLIGRHRLRRAREGSAPVISSKRIWKRE
jgi:carbamoyltransferase